MLEVKAGVLLFDWNKVGGLWVYLPVERWTETNSHGWTCDVMKIVHGECTAHAGVRFSDRYLSGMSLEPPP